MSTYGSHIETGITGLDNILSGGLTANRLYLVEGDPGSGKTTLALQFLLAGIRRGESCMFVTMSESKEELYASAESHGWNLDGINELEIIASEDRLKQDSRYTKYHPSEVELGETIKTVLAEAERIKPPRLVFDSLSELRLLAENPLRYRRQILAFKQYFSRRQSTVLLIDDKSGQERDMHLHSLAHGVISLDRKTAEYGSMRRRLQVGKLRGRAFSEGFHDYVIRRGGLAKGTSTLIMGAAGTGKSALATQYARVIAASGQHASIFLFDEAITTFKQRSASLGIDVEDLINEGRLNVQQVDPAELAPGEFAHAVRQAVDQQHTQLVVIDSLNGYLNAMPSDRFLTLHMHELLTYLNQQGVTTLLLMAQNGLIGTDTRSPIDASYIADTVMLLRYFEAFGEVRQAISVIKKRTGRHERSIRELKLDHGIVVGPPLRDFHGILQGAPQFISHGLERDLEHKQ